MQQWADKHPVGFTSLSQCKHPVDNPLTSHSHLRTEASPDLSIYPECEGILTVRADFKEDFTSLS